MFSISHQQINGFNAIILADENTGTKVTVVPDCGAMLHGFEVQHNGQSLNIIDHYIDIEDYKNNQASKGFKSARLSPFACRLKNGRYNFAAQEYTIQKFYLGKHAMHGLVFDAEFAQVKETATERSAIVKMEYAYRGEDEGYPFCYDCIVEYELSEASYLSITTMIVNKDQGAIPIADGWHPYFTFGGNINDLQLEFQSKAKLEFDADMIPTGRITEYEEFTALRSIGNIKFDDCFTLNFAECQPMLVLRDKELKAQLEIYPDKSYPFLQLYTPDERKSIAIENLSAAPDAFNNKIGLIILASGEEKIFKTAFRITSII